MRNVYDVLNPTVLTKYPLFFPTPPFILQVYVLQNCILSLTPKLWFLLCTLPEYSCFTLYLIPTHSLRLSLEVISYAH